MGLGCLLGKPWQPRNSVYLLYRGEQRGGVITNSWTRRWGYHEQMNKGAAFTVHSWIKETGLADLCRSSLCSETVFRLWTACGELSVHTTNIHTGPSPRGSEALGPLTQCPCLCSHTLADGFFCSLQGRVYFNSGYISKGLKFHKLRFEGENLNLWKYK